MAVLSVDKPRLVISPTMNVTELPLTDFTFTFIPSVVFIPGKLETITGLLFVGSGETVKLTTSPIIKLVVLLKVITKSPVDPSKVGASHATTSLSFHKYSGKYWSSFTLPDWKSAKLLKYSSSGIAGSKSIIFNFLAHLKNIFSVVVSSALLS